jgi:hypothetical protein
MNIGQWFCDGERHLAYKDYQTNIDRLVQKIRSRDAGGGRRWNEVVWHETDIMFLRADDWIRAYGDQRTNIKIAKYNEYATAEMKKVGVPIIPSFAITLPLFAGLLRLY